jgi:hypothetical protein
MRPISRGVLHEMAKIAQLHAVAQAGSMVLKVLAVDPEEQGVLAALLSWRS